MFGNVKWIIRIFFNTWRSLTTRKSFQRKLTYIWGISRSKLHIRYGMYPVLITETRETRGGWRVWSARLVSIVLLFSLPISAGWPSRRFSRARSHHLTTKLTSITFCCNSGWVEWLENCRDQAGAMAAVCAEQHRLLPERASRLSAERVRLRPAWPGGHREWSLTRDLNSPGCNFSQCQVLLCWVQGTPVGFCTLKRKGRPVPGTGGLQNYALDIIDSVFIRKSHRGRGLATALIDHLINIYPR